jgi:hypothetical protein
MITAAAERMRRMRARRQADRSSKPILYETEDWQDFLKPESLPRKAGCQPNEIGRVILKELVDNALDTGASTVTLDDHGGPGTDATVKDDGPGLDPSDVVKLFAVNRPLRSSKKVRRPLRGMLGNGLRVVMGAIAAFEGTIHVTSRGHALILAVDPLTGKTTIVSDEPVPEKSGLAVRIAFPQAMFSEDAFALARLAIRLVEKGAKFYRGPSLPSWYSPAALLQLIAAAPKGVKPPAVIRDAFGIKDQSASLDPNWCKQFLAKHHNGKVEIGRLGENAFGGYYRAVTGTADFDGAKVPFTVEAFVTAKAADKGDGTAFDMPFFLNGSLSLAKLSYHADSTGLTLYGCGLDIKIGGPKRANYSIAISVITPYLQLTGDGKAPHLGPFATAIEKALKDAAGRAYRNMKRPEGMMSVVDAAYAVMAEAYAKASDGGERGQLPAKARQIMYAARPDILRLTGRKSFSDKDFTQYHLPDFQRDYPEETENWNVVYDARGHLVEPHTGESVPLGTLQVRQYLGLRPRFGGPKLADGLLFPTAGPLNRYRNVLFVEKEGFDELFEAVRLAERFDIAVMSTKGMSVIAAHELIDRIAKLVDKVLVMHDFDVSGFSILGTLGTDSRRYEFENDLSDKIVDIGLRLDDIVEMGLDPEIVEVENRAARRKTLWRHGATPDEIEFLAPEDEDEDCQRVELNAMTTGQLVDFVERKLTENGVAKLVPDRDTLDAQARRLIEHRATRAILKRNAKAIARKAAETKLPANLPKRVTALLDQRPELSWDMALDVVLHGEE